MSTNLHERCTCSHHRLLKFIKEGASSEATLLLRELENPCVEIKNSKRTLLHYAMQYKNTTIVQPLIDYGCNVNATDISGMTPLMLAIQDSNLTAVEIFLKNNANVYVSNRLGWNPLQMACLKLYDRVPSDFNDCGEFAVLKKVFEIVNNDFLKDKNLTTKLILKVNNTVKLAVVANANGELAKIVLKNDYPLNFHESRRGVTALHVAIMLRNIENVSLLIEHGADVDARDYSGQSAIYCYLDSYKAVDENSEVLQKLLSRTTSFHLLNGKRVSDLEHFLMTGKERIVRAVLQKTIQSHIDISAMKFHSGKSLLHILTDSYDDPDVCKILDELDIQYDLNARDASECSVLTSALCSGRYKTVDFLLKRGAKVTMTKQDSENLFYTVNLLHSNTPNVQEYIPRIVPILLEHGVEVQYVFEGGTSLIKRLCYKRREKVLNIGEKMIIAHLALLAKINDSALTDLTRQDIESEKLFKDYFDFCTKQLEELRKVNFYGTVTLLNLLTKDQEHIAAYARNEEFISAFWSVITQNSHLEQYYSIILNRRVTKAMDTSSLDEQLACIIENLTGLSSNVYFIIVYTIISYLSPQDKYNLSKVEGMLYEKK